MIGFSSEWEHWSGSPEPSCKIRPDLESRFSQRGSDPPEKPVDTRHETHLDTIRTFRTKQGDCLRRRRPIVKMLKESNLKQTNQVAPLTDPGCPDPKRLPVWIHSAQRLFLQPLLVGHHCSLTSWNGLGPKILRGGRSLLKLSRHWI